jgi:uncharacterized protein
MGYGDTSESCGCDVEVRQARGRVAFVAAAPKARICVKQSGLSRWLALFSVRVYQVFLGPFFGGACKFSPSCSKYAYEAIERFGARRGAWLAAKRVLRCRPFSKGGFDPVPEELSNREDAGRDVPHGTNPHDGRAVEVLR